MTNTKRIFSTVLAAICLFAFSLFEPIYALSDRSAADRRASEAITELNNIWDEGNDGNAVAYSPIVGELLEMRQENEKHLLREDGAIELIVYPDAVHYLEDKEWKAIDNTLVEQKNKEKKSVFTNKSNDFNVSFAADMNEVTVSYQGETLSFAPIESKSKNATASIVKKEATRGILTSEQKDEAWRFPEELTSSVVYSSNSTRSGEQNESVEYRLEGKRLSEFITLNKRPGDAPVYSYFVKTSLKPILEGNTVMLVNKSGETVFVFSAPIMQDAKGEESGDFKVVAEDRRDGFTYTIIPSAEWLNAKERVYPVVIDPDINVNFKNNVEDTFISSNNPNTVYGASTSPAASTIQIGGSNTGYRSMIRLKNLPTLKAGDVIIEAYLILTAYDAMSAACTEIDAYALNTGNWSASNMTWNKYAALNGGNPANYDKVETLALVPATGCQTAFNVTPIMKKWISGEMTNGGLILVSPNNNHSKFWSSRCSNSYYYQPYYKIVYVNSTGLESRFSYSNQSVGRAGEGSVNLYSGNLTFTASDAGINNGTMPISVNHVYNTNDKDKDIGYGYGWRLNYAQYIEAVCMENRTETATYYEYIDGDGTRHYYKKETSTKYVNELDKDSVLTIDRSNGILTIKDKGDNKLVFTCGYFDHDNNSSTQTEFLGHLTSIEDANGNKTLITYDTASFNGSVYRNMRIKSVTEKLAANSSNGQSITFTYDSNKRLSKVTAPDGLNQTYAYSNGDLSSIGYADGKTSTYSYNAHKLIKAKNIDDYSINYEYNANDRVIKASEKQGDTNGNYLTYDYGWNVTTEKDNLGRDTIYQFNNAGQAVSIRNAEGQAVFAAYKKEDRETTKLAAVSKMQYTIVNLLNNHGFDIGNSGSGWTRSADAIFYSGMPHTGNNSVRLKANSYVEQTVSVQSGRTYTFSAYFTGAAGGYVEVLSGSTSLATSDAVATYGTTGTDWARGACTFTVPSGVSSVKVRIRKNSANTSYTYADSAQLEVGETPNRYNMLINSDFTNGATQYATNGISTSVDKVVTVNDASHPSYLSGNVMKLTGNAATYKRVYQDIAVRDGKIGDTYSFGGWCKSNSVPLSTQIYNYNTLDSRQYGFLCLKAQFYYGDTFRNEVVSYFSVDTDDWQYTCSSAVAEGTYNKIRLTICFDYSRNEAYFDGLQLHREQFSQSYTYDANGNLTGYLSLIGQQPTLTYDSNNNVTSSKDARGNTTTYTYDSKHNLLTSKTPLGTVTTNTYDTNGNIKQTKVGNSTDYISSSTTYDNASALATAVTDARGNSVTYGYNSATRQQTSITDAKGNTSTYNYGNAASMLRLASLSSAGTGTVNYAYDQYGKLTQIARSTTNYNFTYDSWGRQLATKVGDTALSTNAYDQYGRLSSITYGNGFKTEYEYDNLDRTSKIYERANASASQQLAYEFIYDGEDELYELRNYKTNRAVFFEYDHAGRCMASKEKNFSVSGGKITYTGTAASYKYDYDLNNNLTKLTNTINGTSWTTTYTYDKDDRPTVTTLYNGKKITDTYDIIGRITKRRLGLSSNYDTDITYIAGANGSKTALVSTYKNGSDDAYTYAYDANGNITSITKGSMSFTYTYDAANQLVRENLKYGNNNSDNATYTYEYDAWGNILNKKKYAYTTGALGAVQNTVNYTYGNDQWKDQLTSYNGQSISYDSMGNPISYLDATLSWNGKQLTGYSKGGTNVTYAYNEDGLRTRKTVNGTDTDYYYNGSLLMAMTNGSITQRFSYDAQGKVVSVNYNGTEYYYLRNAQGDIVKLISNNNDSVVEYTYDSWGKLIATTGSMASTLGNDQPFRYRGYVYDSETQWYYLQSRYYNPEVCRFISSDVLLSTGQGVLGHNAYAYCLNNPVNRSDDEGNLSFWQKIAIGVAVIAVVAVATAVTVATAGAGSAAACVAVSALTGAVKGAAIGAVTGAAIGASTSAVSHRVKTGSWKGAGKAALYGARDGFADGFMTGAITGAVSGALNPTACFVAGTAILSADGYITIETIKEGDYVYATDPETGESGYKRVVQTFEKETYELINVKVDGETITTTPTHPFYVPQNGWTEAVQLRAGDILVTCNGEYVVVEQVQHEILETPVTVYNFEVEDFHTYYVAENDQETPVLVHNSCSFRNSLKKYTGSDGVNMQAHHVFPQKFIRNFKKIGIDITNPKFGAWVKPGYHQSFSYAYNKAWADFFANGGTRSGAFALAKKLATQYGYKIYF